MKKQECNGSFKASIDFDLRSLDIPQQENDPADLSNETTNRIENRCKELIDTYLTVGGGGYGINRILSVGSVEELTLVQHERDDDENITAEVSATLNIDIEKFYAHPGKELDEALRLINKHVGVYDYCYKNHIDTGTCEILETNHLDISEEADLDYDSPGL